MTLPRSAADALARHVVFELECIDRVYCNLYVPKLQRDLGVVGFIREHLGMPVASTAALSEKTEAFYEQVRRFASGNEYAKAVAARAGIGFTPLDNEFAAVDDVAAVQAICDSSDEKVIWDLAAKWTAILPQGASRHARAVPHPHHQGRTSPACDTTPEPPRDLRAPRP
jgi:hypothetical protein